MIAEIIQKVAGMQKRESIYKIRPSLASPEISELGYKGRCKRAMVYNALNFPQDNISDRLELIFDDSNWHEELTIDWINKTSFKLRSRGMVLDCGYFGSGHIDGILTDILGNDYLWEHKALNHFSFEKLDRGKELPIDYIAQCCIYLWGLKQYEVVHQALLLIKNKNTAQYLEFLIDYDIEEDNAIVLWRLNSIDQEKRELNIKIPNILGRCKEKFEFVEEKKREKILPKRDYNLSDWQCSYCGWRNTCWKEYKEEVEKYTIGELEVSNEVETALEYYLKLNMHLKEMEKEKEKISQQIKDILKERQMKEALIGGKYVVNLSITKTSQIDKSKIPFNILEQATIQNFVERLNIRLKKGGEKNGGL